MARADDPLSGTTRISAIRAAATQPPDETFDMLFEKQNAALDGFNQWTINGVSYPSSQMMATPNFHLREGKRYRIRMRNASDDIHPIHLHRHSFELTRIAGQPTSGVYEGCGHGRRLPGSRDSTSSPIIPV